MEARTFTTRHIQLNNYLSCFPIDPVRPMVTALPDDEVKEILYHIIPNLWRKKFTKQGYNYLDRSIQEMSSRVKNLETQAPPPALSSQPRKKKYSK